MIDSLVQYISIIASGARDLVVVSSVIDTFSRLMFRNLGLFASYPCPDQSCSRPTCFFKHGSTSQLPATRVPAKRKESAKDSPEKKVKTGNLRDAGREEQLSVALDSPKAKITAVKSDLPAVRPVPAPSPVRPKVCSLLIHSIFAEADLGM